MSRAASPPDRDPRALALAEIEVDEREGVRIVAVAGELDISNVSALENATLDLPNDALGIVLDLSAATYIDSATLGLLFRLHRGLGRRGQSLRVICAPGSSARRVLELTGFERDSTPARDRAAAIAAIRGEVAPHE